MNSISGVAQEAHALAQQADKLRARCEALAASAQDDANRATLARVAGRLGLSVVRPLSSPGTEGDQLAAEPPDSESELPHALHLLAVDATRLRVRAPRALSLQEATAALQDLACQSVAEDVQRLQARRSELAALMTGLPATIQSAPNGPYLLTNVDTITDCLGIVLDPAPQAALCRCGASTIKPWCDGLPRPDRI